MTAENSIEQDELTQEELELALDAGRELARITVALDALSASYQDSSRREDGKIAVPTELFETRVWLGLQKRREELHGMLLAIG